VVGAIGLAMVVATAGASAQVQVEIEIGVPVGGPDTIAIECTWVLMDMDDDPASGFEYRIGDATDDDEPRRNDGTLQPCDFHDDAFDAPTYDSALIDNARVPSHGVIQVNANKGDGHMTDLDGAQSLEIWTAIDLFGSSVGRDVRVSHDVFHPDGTAKFQLYADEVPCASNADLLALGYDTTFKTISAGEDSMFGAASFAGGAGTLQISIPALTAEGAGGYGIAEQCQQEIKELYRSSFELSKHQPAGLYRVRTTATDRSDTEVLDDVTFYVQRSVSLRADFGVVAFPMTSPGGVARVGGDVVWDLGGANNKPTLYNDGVSGTNLTVSFSRLCGGLPGAAEPGECPEDNVQAKQIAQFDVSFGLNSSQLKHFRPEDGGGVTATGVAPGGLFPNAEADFGDGDYQTLCANETGKIDFSAHLENALGLSAGMQLAGTVTIMSRLDTGSAGEDEGGPWGPNFTSVNPEDGTVKTCNNDNWFWGGSTGVDYDGSPADYRVPSQKGLGPFADGLYGQPNGRSQNGNSWDSGLPRYTPDNYGNQRTPPDAANP
jgi:hypothetical protein